MASIALRHSFSICCSRNWRCSTLKKIDFDILDRAQGLAPFVSPMVAGKAVQERGYVTRSFEPAYVKPKTTIKRNKPLRRRPGEAVGGTMSPGARRNAIIAETLEQHMNAIIRRKEWMAAQALTTGAVVVSGDGYPTTTVDFQRDASLTTSLPGGSQWGDGGVSIIDSVEAEATKIADLSGAVVTDVIMEPGAWQIARKDTEFQEALDNRRQDGGQAQFGSISSGEGNWGRMVGMLGDVAYWTYQQPYTDDAGAAQKMMPANGVIFASRQLEGYQAHGAILDPEFDYVAAELWPKDWIEKDPAQEFVMTQSAPLVIPARPNAASFVTVA